jgi:hypothetical protein
LIDRVRKPEKHNDEQTSLDSPVRFSFHAVSRSGCQLFSLEALLKLCLFQIKSRFQVTGSGFWELGFLTETLLCYQTVLNLQTEEVNDEKSCS